MENLQEHHNPATFLNLWNKIASNDFGKNGYYDERYNRYVKAGELPWK